MATNNLEAFLKTLNEAESWAKLRNRLQGPEADSAGEAIKIKLETLSNSEISGTKEQQHSILERLADIRGQPDLLLQNEVRGISKLIDLRLRMLVGQLESAGQRNDNDSRSAGGEAQIETKYSLDWVGFNNNPIDVNPGGLWNMFLKLSQSKRQYELWSWKDDAPATLCGFTIPLDAVHYVHHNSDVRVEVILEGDHEIGFEMANIRVARAFVRDINGRRPRVQTDL